jgi:WD40 repeat protein
LAGGPLALIGEAGMSRIFLSHSARETRQALALKKWLAEQRPELANEIFIDVDPETGLRLGQQWDTQLLTSNSRCEYVVCLLSANWLASTECRVEYRTAEGFGKRILIARLEDSGDGDITSRWQRCDLFAGDRRVSIELPDGPPVNFSATALDQLKKAIEGDGVGPENFVWPPTKEPQRAPYRGWAPFEDIDAGVFFGRDAAITRGLDELCAMRFRLLAELAGRRSLFVVLGQSGSGKSSFLRAGLIPRLQRDDTQFAVLGVVRPERSPLTGDHGLAAAIWSACETLRVRDTSLGDIKSACLAGADQISPLLVRLREAAAARLTETADHTPPTLVLPLDQAEELFSSDAGVEAAAFLQLTAEVMRRMNATDLGLAVAATIRTDRYEAMQNQPALDGLGTVLFDELKPMPPAEFKQVITGPAARAGEGGQRLSIDALLVNELLADAAEGADTLPLLALTLARLYTDYASTGQLTLRQYRAGGGMRNVVDTAINEVLAAEPSQRARQLELLRSAFIPWLATITPDSDQPVRRVARYSDLPPDSIGLIDKLVDKRLLVRDERDGEVVVEVALESLLRQWSELADWLSIERRNLRTTEDIERSATAWEVNRRDDAWLLQGTRLADAIALADAPNYRDRLNSTRAFLDASRQNEDERLRKEHEHQQAELRAAQDRQAAAEALANAESKAREEAQAHASAMRKRARVMRAVLALTAVIALIAVFGLVAAVMARNRADERTRQATALQLAAEGQAMASNARPGGDIRGIQQVLAGNYLAPGAQIDDAALSVLNATRFVLKTREVGAFVWSVAVSPDGRRIVSAAKSRNQPGPPEEVYDAETLQPVDADPAAFHLPISPYGQPMAFSFDGTLRVEVVEDHLELYDVATDKRIRTFAFSDRSLSSARFSPDGKRIVTSGWDNTLRLWDVATGEQIGAPFTGHTDRVLSADFSLDGKQIVSGSADKTIRIWDVFSHKQIGDPFIGHTADVGAVAFNPDRTRVVSGSKDTTIRLWDPATGKQVGASLIGHTDEVMTVAFFPDGRRIASGGGDRVIRVWDTDPPAPLGTPLTGHAKAITAVAFSPDGTRMVSSSKDTTLRLWDTAIGQPVVPAFVGHTEAVNSVAFSPDGKRIVSGGSDKSIRLWDTATADQIKELPTGSAVGSVAFNADGSRVVASTGNAVVVWDIATADVVCTSDNTRSVDKAWFSPDGRQIVAMGTYLLMRFDSSSCQIDQQYEWPDDYGLFEYGAISPDGARVTGVFNPGGGFDLAQWDVATGREVTVLRRFGGPDHGTSVAYSPDGRWIVSVDEFVSGWEATTGDQIRGIVPSDGVAVAVSPDGRTVAVGNGAGVIREWNLPWQRPGELCARLSSNMNRQQWHDWVSPDIPYHELCPGLPEAPVP